MIFPKIWFISTEVLVESESGSKLKKSVSLLYDTLRGMYFCHFQSGKHPEHYFFFFEI